jgi:hypothetical protein
MVSSTKDSKTTANNNTATSTKAVYTMANSTTASKSTATITKDIYAMANSTTAKNTMATEKSNDVILLPVTK